ncbi:DNA replication and repair protein RecF [compost metagenome]
MSGMPVKKFSSQGQRKSYIMALKLAQFDAIYREKGVKPILLLDDIFDKLDDRRIERLITMIRDGAFGQVFITDARAERTAEVLGESDVNMVEL